MKQSLLRRETLQKRQEKLLSLETISLKREIWSVWHGRENVVFRMISLIKIVVSYDYPCYSVRSEYKRIWSEYLFTLKRIKQFLFACFASKRISEFYMRNEYKRKRIFLSKRIFYLFCFKAKILKQNEANFSKKNRLLIEA